MQGNDLELRKDPDTGESYYFDLISPAMTMDRWAQLGSYDLFPFFADMENYWNGNL